MTAAGWETAAALVAVIVLVTLLVVPGARRGRPRGPVPAARLAAAVAAARQRDAAAHLRDHDDVVQALVVATYALQLGDEHRARAAVDGALRQSRAILDRALAAAGHDALTRPPESGQPTSAAPTPHTEVSPRSQTAVNPDTSPVTSHATRRRRGPRWRPRHPAASSAGSSGRPHRDAA